MSLASLLQKLDAEKEAEVIKVAGEAISVEQEKEYCLWVKPTAAGWSWLAQQQAGFFLDVMMPIENGKRRVRITPEGAVLTYKTFVDGVREEKNSDIDQATALTFYADGYLAHLVRRLSLPAGELESRGAKHWDIDVFFAYRDHPQIPDMEALNELFNTASSGTSFGEWVKVELEVERYELESIAEFLPFEIEDSIPGTPKDAVSQELIRHYWDSVTRI